VIRLRVDWYGKHWSCNAVIDCSHLPQVFDLLFSDSVAEVHSLILEQHPAGLAA